MKFCPNLEVFSKYSRFFFGRDLRQNVCGKIGIFICLRSGYSFPIFVVAFVSQSHHKGFSLLSLSQTIRFDNEQFYKRFYYYEDFKFRGENETLSKNRNFKNFDFFLSHPLQLMISIGDWINQYNK